MRKFVFEYPSNWVKDSNPQNMIFLNNITSSLIDLNLLLNLIPVSYPTYGIPRLKTDNCHLSFHSYENPENVWSYKEAPIKGLYSIDPTGYGGWSDIAKNLVKYSDAINQVKKSDEILAPFIQQLKSGVSKYKQSKSKVSLKANFILFALQVRTDSVADQAYLDVAEILIQLSDLAIKYQKRVVVKLHPKCDSELLKALVFKISEENEWVEVSNSDITQLIQLSNCVLACNSGVSLEALLLNKKVFCFGESEWASITHKLTQLDQVEDIFLTFDQPYTMSEYQKKYLAFLLSKYWVRFDDKIAIKNKLVDMLKASTHVETHLDLEERSQLNVIHAQKDYTNRIKKINLLERDFEHQKKLLKNIRSNPFFVFVYFFKFNLLKLKSKLK